MNDRERLLDDLRDYRVNGVIESGPHNPLKATVDELRSRLGVEPIGMKKSDLRKLIEEHFAEAIPNDILETARRIVRGLAVDFSLEGRASDVAAKEEETAAIATIARAILSERKRCAAICREIGKTHNDGYYDAPNLCARTILGEA